MQRVASMQEQIEKGRPNPFLFINALPGSSFPLPQGWDAMPLLGFKGWQIDDSAAYLQATLQAVGLADGVAPFDNDTMVTDVYRSLVAWQWQKKSEAILLGQHAVERWPTAFAAWYILGYMQGHTEGRRLEAIPVFQRFLALNPLSLAAWEWLAGLYESDGQLLLTHNIQTHITRLYATRDYREIC